MRGLGFGVALWLEIFPEFPLPEPFERREDFDDRELERERVPDFCEERREEAEDYERDLLPDLLEPESRPPTDRNESRESERERARPRRSEGRRARRAVERGRPLKRGAAIVGRRREGMLGREAVVD